MVRGFGQSMILDDYIKAKLVDFAWSRAEYNNGSVCVMYVLRKRANEENGNWMRAMHDVEEAPRKRDLPDPRDPKFQELLGYVDGIYSGETIDKWTAEARFWWDGSGDPWFSLPDKERVGQVGNLIFWK